MFFDVSNIRGQRFERIHFSWSNQDGCEKRVETNIRSDVIKDPSLFHFLRNHVLNMDFVAAEPTGVTRRTNDPFLAPELTLQDSNRQSPRQGPEWKTRELTDESSVGQRREIYHRQTRFH